MRRVALILLLLSACGEIARRPLPEPAIDATKVAERSAGCVTCHTPMDDPDMHLSASVKLGCTDCHGGDATATEKALAHVQPRFPEAWPTSANPPRTYGLLNAEDPNFVRFVNPGDLRVAHVSCGPCHEGIVDRVRKSMMTTSPLVYGAALYNNGTIAAKEYVLGESYTWDGKPQSIQGVAEYDAQDRKVNVRWPTDEERARGVLRRLDPIPRWNAVPPGTVFRANERGGEVARNNPSNVGVPNQFEDPGKPDAKLSVRGAGTETSIDGVVLNALKIRLNDPHLSFMGSNDNPGDYRQSGCSACHVLYANDRSVEASGPIAAYGNRGCTQTADPTIPRGESGHPLRHQFAREIPSSQCMTCHHHQANGFLDSYFGYMIWDLEADGKAMWPETPRVPTDEEWFEQLQANPWAATARGKWADPEFLAESGGEYEQTKFADSHGHGWLYRAIYRRDREGNLLDAEGRHVESIREAQHLNDVHAKAGMHCIDCHTLQDVHGDGKLYGEYANAVEIACVDCHGTIARRFGEGGAQPTSGPAGGRTDLLHLTRPDGSPRFVAVEDGTPLMFSMIGNKQWEIPQIRDVIDPSHERYNEAAALAKTMRRDGKTWGSAEGDLAHGYDDMECFACHTSWTPSCYGCHFPAYANERRPVLHYDDEPSRGWSPYNFQVVRGDLHMLGRNGRGKISTVRSSSAVVVSVQSGQREWIVSQQPTISAPGYGSQAFAPFFGHTVGTRGNAKQCTDCHVADDNNAWMAMVLMQGSDASNFMGRYVYVAEADAGLEAIAVTEQTEPQAVIGSSLHRRVYGQSPPPQVVSESTAGVRSLQLRGEYLYAACGEGGFRIFDVASIDNKGVSEKIFTAPVSALGQDTHVETAFATSVALPSTTPMHDRNDILPAEFWAASREQKMHPLFRYAYITDRVEGLIVVDVNTLSDGDPRNNDLSRAATFPLDGAEFAVVAGTQLYVCTPTALAIVSIDRPLEPRLLASLPLSNPRQVEVQFRYAFVTDDEGLRVVDVAFPERPALRATAPIPEAGGLAIGRTYAYVAAGSRGLAIVDITKAEEPGEPAYHDVAKDACDVQLGMIYGSTFAYVADGRHGLRVVELTSGFRTPEYMGWSPTPDPLLVATYETDGPALALSRGLRRDRAVDESGHQVNVFGRLGSRPLTAEEMRRMSVRAANERPGPPVPFK